MKYVTYIILCFFVFCSCKQKLALNDVIVRGEAKDKNPKLSVEFMKNSGLHEGKNLIFTTDASCSVCKYEYLQLARSLSLLSEPYDSLFVFAENAIDSLDLEYPLYKSKTPTPVKRRYILDKSCIDSISNFLVNFDFGIVKNGQLVFVCNIQSLEYDEETGLYMYKK